MKALDSKAKMQSLRSFAWPCISAAHEGETLFSNDFALQRLAPIGPTMASDRINRPYKIGVGSRTSHQKKLGADVFSDNMPTVRLRRTMALCDPSGTTLALFDTVNTSVPDENGSETLIFDGEAPEDYCGPVQMFNVPNPASDAAENVQDADLKGALCSHCATSEAQLKALPEQIRSKAQGRRPLL